MSRLTEEMIITNSHGMHLRPAQRLVQTVLNFKCEVFLEKDSERVNAKSIMGLLTLVAAQGAQVIVICDGEDAAVAMDSVRDLIESGFGDD